MEKERWPSGPGFYINMRRGAAIVHRWSSELAEALTATRAKAVRIQEDWPESGLDALLPFRAQVEKVVVERELPDLSALGQLSQLRELSIRGSAETVDFARLPKLETMSMWSDHPTFGNLRDCPSLKKLSIVNCGLVDLEALAGLKQLLELGIGEAPLRSLKGVEELPSLQRLVLSQVPLDSLVGVESAQGLSTVTLFRLRPLTSIVPLLRLPRLRVLEIDGSKKIADLERLGEIAGLEELRLISLALPDVNFLSRLSRLRVLALAHVGKIPSLGFLRGLTSLEGLGLLENTTVEDGDLSVLLHLPALKRCQYTEHRHYSPRKDEIQAALRAKGGVVDGSD